MTLEELVHNKESVSCDCFYIFTWDHCPIPSTTIPENFSTLLQDEIIPCSFNNRKVYIPYKAQDNYFPDYLLKVQGEKIYFASLPKERIHIKDFSELEKMVENNFGFKRGFHLGSISIPERVDKWWQFEPKPILIILNSERLFYFEIDILFPQRFFSKYGAIHKIESKEIWDEIIKLEVSTSRRARYLYDEDSVINMEYDFFLLNYQIKNIETEGHNLK
jgi:hypothetical protein